MNGSRFRDSQILFPHRRGTHHEFWKEELFRFSAVGASAGWKLHDFQPGATTRALEFQEVRKIHLSFFWE